MSRIHWNNNTISSHKDVLSSAVCEGTRQRHEMRQRLAKLRSHREKTNCQSQYYFDWIRQYRVLEVEEKSRVQKLHNCIRSNAGMGLAEHFLNDTTLQDFLFDYKRDLGAIKKLMQILAKNNSSSLSEKTEFKQAEIAEMVLHTREGFLKKYFEMEEDIQSIKREIKTILEKEKTIMEKSKQSHLTQGKLILPQQLIKEIENLEADFKMAISHPASPLSDDKSEIIGCSSHFDKIDGLRARLTTDYQEVEDAYLETVNQSNQKFNEAWPCRKKEESKVHDWDDESRISFRKAFQKFQNGKLMNPRERKSAIFQISRETGRDESECVEYWKWFEDTARRKEREKTALVMKNRAFHNLLSLSLEKIAAMRHNLTESFFHGLHNDIHHAVSTQRQERIQFIKQVRDQEIVNKKEEQNQIHAYKKIIEGKKDHLRRREMASRKILVEKYNYERESIQKGKLDMAKKKSVEEKVKRKQRMSHNGQRYVFKLQQVSRFKQNTLHYNILQP